MLFTFFPVFLVTPYLLVAFLSKYFTNLDPFESSVPLIYSLKTLGNQRFSNNFRGYRNVTFHNIFKSIIKKRGKNRSSTFFLRLALSFPSLRKVITKRLVWYFVMILCNVSKVFIFSNVSKVFIYTLSLSENLLMYKEVGNKSSR